MSRRSRLVRRPQLERLELRCVLSTVTPSGLSPAQLTSAYGLNAISFASNGKTVTGNGAGQTIAIVDAYSDPYIVSEVNAFNAKFNLPALNLSVVNPSNASYDTGWAEEIALDVEWAHAAAPGASIVLVEAASSNVTDLIAAVNTAKSLANVSVISMSWGGAEFSGQTRYDSTFTTPANHIGITFLASAGDTPSGAQWPASSPNVVGVGGTSLNVTSTGARVSEVAWASTGGGTSRYESEPTYQLGVQSTGRRDAPDVSLDANPNTGVAVYSAAAGGWIQVGGTSLSSPVWAGLIAIADQGRALAGKPTLDGPSQTLPDLYKAPTGSFNSVSSSSSARPSTNYTTTTGLGTPNAPTLIAALVADPAVGAATGGTSTGGTTTTTGGGTTTTTGGGTTTTTGGGSNGRRRHAPYGGSWGFLAANATSGNSTPVSQNGWSGPYLPPNPGQGAPPSTRPIVPFRLMKVSEVAPPKRPGSTPVPSTPAATDMVLASW